MARKRKTTPTQSAGSRPTDSTGVRGSFRPELYRMALVVILASALGLAFNALSAHPLAVMASDLARGTLTSTGGLNASSDANDAGNPGRVTVKELMLKWNDPLEQVRVIDVRGEAEFDSGHVPNSIHLQLDSIVKSRQEFDGALRDATLIAVLCDSDQCSKSGEAAKVLTQLGYKNVRVLAGGWEAYKNSGYQVEEAPR